MDLYEKGDRLVGVFEAAASFLFQKEHRDLPIFYRRRSVCTSVAVHMNVSGLVEIPADEYVIATGFLPA